MHKKLYQWIFILILLTSQTLYGDESTTHQELRAILTGLEQAVNAAEYEKIEQYFSKDMRVTTINQEILSKHSDIVPYFERWTGKDGYIKKIEMKLHADEKTQFYGDDIGIVWGWGEERYLLSDTRFFDMKTRWTPTVIKESDGVWRILTLHIGTNFLDNPVINAIEKSTKTMTAIALAVGLLLGLLIGFLLWKRKKKTA